MGQVSLIHTPDLWLEGNAVRQLQTTAELPAMRRVAGMPDLHAGRGYPVGAAFFSTGCFYPALIGNDIGCGMAWWQTDLPTRSKTDKLIKQLGSIDDPLDDAWAERIAELLPNHPFQAALGTIGGGNHFAELQTVDTVYRPELLPSAFDPNCLQLLVHSGSRGLGQQILRRHVDAFGHHGLPEHSPPCPKRRKTPCIRWRAQDANGSAANAKAVCRTNFQPTACAATVSVARWCVPTKPCCMFQLTGQHIKHNPMCCSDSYGLTSRPNKKADFTAVNGGVSNRTRKLTA